MPGGPAGAAGGNAAPDPGADPGAGDRGHPGHLPHPPQADSQPGADPSGQIPVQTHGVGAAPRHPGTHQVEKAKALFSVGEERFWGARDGIHST